MKKTKRKSILEKQVSERVKKHVAAIHTSGELSLLERKMANVFLLNAYDELLTKRSHSIKVQLLSTMLGWNESNNTERLKSALSSLASTPISFNVMKDGKESWQVMSMISYGHIQGGVCTYRYDEYLAERMYDPDIYATINLGIQRKLDGSYALALYENCLRYRSVGSTGWWDLQLFRRLVGAENEYYDDFRRLNSRIIKTAVSEINKVTDIIIQPEFQKLGRKVTAIRFIIGENPQQTLLNSDDLDEYSEIKKTDVFKHLREHGIGERLAILWVMQDEERAKKVVAYVESKAQKKQVKGSTAGYIRKLIEDNAEVGKSQFENKLEQESQTRINEEKEKINKDNLMALKAEFNRERVTEEINKLTIERKRELVSEYIKNDGFDKAKSYNETTVKFRDSIERILFNVWLRKRFAIEGTVDEFSEWLHGKENLGI